ncbi:MAG TPA: ribonuclease E/G [Alphaproteobacteria bacterium]
MRAPRRHSIVDEVLVEVAADRLRAAAVADGELLELAVEPLNLRGATGSIYLGRVVRAAPALRGVFVEIGLDRPALLDVNGAAPAEGTVLPVQVIEAARGDKAARVSRRLALEGRYAVLLPGGKGAAVSRAVAAERTKRRLQDLAMKLKAAGEGVILRAAAAEASRDALGDDLAALRSRWGEIKAGLADAAPPACVFDNGDAVARLLRRFAGASIPRFVVDDAMVARRVRGTAERLLGVTPEVETDAQRGTLLTRHGIDEALASTEMRELRLPSGGRITIETTAALTAVDVDTAQGAKDNADAALRADLEAAAEIGRQLRLRDLGGVVVVDFVRLRDKAQRAQVEAALREAVSRDRIAVQVLGWTAAGLFEMIRPRARAMANLE